MADTGAREEQQRALRIVSKCTSVDEFVSIFRRFCDEKSLFIVTKKPKSLGTQAEFAITLADGKAMLKGKGTVVDSYPDKHNSFGRPGMKLRFDDLDAHSREVLERLNQAKKAKKLTPPPLPRHMRAKSEGESVPPASPELTGLGASDGLDEDDQTQVDAEPGLQASASAAREERRKGSDFVLPANPFGELTDASLEAFVECTLYEETGTLDISTGEIAGGDDEVAEALAVAAIDVESEPDAGAPDSASGELEDASEPATPRALNRPVTVPTVIPPILKEAQAAPRPGSPSTVAAEAPAARSGPAEPAAQPGSAEPAAQPRPATPAPGAVVVPAGVMPVAVGQRQDMTPLPGETTDITPLPTPPGVGLSPADMAALGVAASGGRTWGVRAMLLAVGATLALGLIIGYLVWGRGADRKAAPAGPSGAVATNAEVADAGTSAPEEDKAATASVSGDAGPGAPESPLVDAAAPSPDPVEPADDSTAPAGEGVDDDTASAAVGDPIAGTDECALELVTVPEGARVRVGSSKLGETPYSGEIPCEATVLYVRHPRYAPFKRAISPVPGVTTELTVRLQRPIVQLRVSSSPKGASVTVGGRRVGKTPVTVKVQGFVYANVSVSKKGYKSFSTRVYPKRPVTNVQATLKSTKKPRRRSR